MPHKHHRNNAPMLQTGQNLRGSKSSNLQIAGCGRDRIQASNLGMEMEFSQRSSLIASGRMVSVAPNTGN